MKAYTKYHIYLFSVTYYMDLRSAMFLFIYYWCNFLPSKVINVV